MVRGAQMPIAVGGPAALLSALLQLAAAGEPQPPCPHGGADCLAGRTLGPTSEELSTLGSGLKCPGLHDGADYAAALAAKFKTHDKDGDGHLNMGEAEEYVASLPTGAEARLESCLSSRPALAPVYALTRRNTCALCYSFVDAAEHLWPLHIFKESGLCATSRHCELGFQLTVVK